MQNSLEQLKHTLTEINALYSAAAVLAWDQETRMPARGADARARQIGTLERLAHEQFTSTQMGDLLHTLNDTLEGAGLPEKEAALVRYVHREYERERKVPAALKSALIEHGSRTYSLWARAREADDFSLVQANLERTLELSREVAACFPGREHPMDALIEDTDPGMRAADIRQIFADLRAGLVPLVAEIADRPPPRTDFLHRAYPEADQAAFGLRVIRMIGYDPQRNRQDKTHHPFMIRMSTGDIRITTRYDEADFSDGFFSSLHETGHALYEMGIDPELDGLPIGEGVSAGVHESQSRLWENFIGRSRPFWEHVYPMARQAFSEQLSEIPLDDFYRAINIVRPSLIRTEADEVTYNLHVMIRFDLEMAMLDGSLAIADLPDAWRERYRSDLGVFSETDAGGVLQDVHWYSGRIGGEFQGYTLGNIMAAQVFETAEEGLPTLWEDVRAGQFDDLQGWLTENIYRCGSMYPPAELLVRVTGRELDSGPLLKYLNTKYGEVYGI